MDTVVQVALLLVLFSTHSSTALRCLDDGGNPVDYWFILKPPAIADSGSGVKYFYADASNPTWILSSHNLGDHTTGAVAKTLQQVYHNPSKYGFLFFNDEVPPDNTTFTLGHTKGVFAWDTDGSGFWMPHSAPKFPDFCPGSYTGLKPGQQLFGQNFMCISISNPDEVGQVLEITQPYTYSENPLQLGSYPHLQKAYSGQYVSSPTATSISVRTAGGSRVVAFAKNGAWNNDLYKELVAPSLQKDIYVECWCHPTLSDCYPSTCDQKYAVMRVRNTSIAPYWWDITKDHSKWVVSTDTSTVCFGDINRHASQKVRGGGQYCLQDHSVASGIGIMEFDKCA